VGASSLLHESWYAQVQEHVSELYLVLVESNCEGDNEKRVEGAHGGKMIRSTSTVVHEVAETQRLLPSWSSKFPASQVTKKVARFCKSS
jgi:hypothetical protein